MAEGGAALAVFGPVDDVVFILEGQGYGGAGTGPIVINGQAAVPGYFGIDLGMPGVELLVEVFPPDEGASWLQGQFGGGGVDVLRAAQLFQLLGQVRITAGVDSAAEYVQRRRQDGDDVGRPGRWWLVVVASVMVSIGR